MTGAEKKAGVIGWPVKHSLSPYIHAFWRQELQVSGFYRRIACKPSSEAFSETVKALVELGYTGVNVTLPHKRYAFEFADQHSETAKALGVANMLTFKGGHVFADNSDVYGFRHMLKPLVTEQHKKVLVFGAGGAAPAVCFALKQLGFSDIHVTNRTSEKADMLVEQASHVGAAVSWQGAMKAASTYDAIVNTTSLGMAGAPDLELDLANAAGHTVVADIVYTPLETGLLRAAAARGLKTVNGLSMLMHQAAPGFDTWFGKAPVVSPELESFLHTRLQQKNKEPVRVGLTGSIGMGKSTAAQFLKELGAAVWDADEAVHRLYAEGGSAVLPLSQAFPGVVVDGAVSREKLSRWLMAHPEDFGKLEKIVHPLVAKDRAEFAEAATTGGAKVIVLDIPLLFETGQSHEFDEIIVVTADLEVRKNRVLERPGMTEEKFNSIVTRQLPEKEKVLLADHVIKTDGSFEETRAALSRVYHAILEN